MSRQVDRSTCSRGVVRLAYPTGTSRPVYLFAWSRLESAWGRFSDLPHGDKFILAGVFESFAGGRLAALPRGNK